MLKASYLALRSLIMTEKFCDQEDQEDQEHRPSNRPYCWESLLLYFSTYVQTPNPLMESVSKRSLRGYQVLCDLYKVYTSDLIRFHDSAPYVQNNLTHDPIHVALPVSY